MYGHIYSIMLDPLSPSRKVRESLADVISMHECWPIRSYCSILRQYSNTLASVCKTNTGAVLGLQVMKLITSARPSLIIQEGEIWSSLIDLAIYKQNSSLHFRCDLSTWFEGSVPLSAAFSSPMAQAWWRTALIKYDTRQNWTVFPRGGDGEPEKCVGRVAETFRTFSMLGDFRESTGGVTHGRDFH